jgi:hypothetical protein
VTFPVIGGAVDRLTAAVVPVAAVARPESSIAAVSGDKLGSAASVDPDTAIIPTPGLSLGAGRTASLAGHLNSATRVCIAVMTMAIVRCAIDRLSVRHSRLDKDGTGKQGKKNKWQKPYLRSHGRLSVLKFLLLSGRPLNLSDDDAPAIWPCRMGCMLHKQVCTRLQRFCV